MGRARPIAIDLSRILEPVTVVPPGRVERVAQELRDRLDVEQQLPDPVDLEEFVEDLRLSFAEDGARSLTRLSRIERRWLPWAVFYGQSPRLVDDEDLVAAIVEWVSGVRNTDLGRWVGAYLRHYEPGHSGINQLRAALKNRLVAYPGGKRRLVHWRKHLFLFEQRGPEIAAWNLLGGGEQAAVWLEGAGFRGDLAVGGFVENLTRSALDRCAQEFPTLLDKTFDLLEVEQHGLKHPRSPRLIRTAASKLLPLAGGAASDEIQDAMQPLFMRHLGDPRIAGSAPRWQAVSQEARDVFRQWLSRKDIEFFFELVGKSAGDPKWKYRAAFWRTYIPHIENTWVALGLGAQVLRRTEGGRLQSCGALRGTQRDQSIFFIRLGGHDFMEWSHAGACRIWEQGQGPFEFGQRLYERHNIMRSTDYVHRVSHFSSERYRWQSRLASWIQQRSGIRGVGSYRIQM